MLQRCDAGCTNPEIASSSQARGVHGHWQGCRQLEEAEHALEPDGATTIHSRLLDINKPEARLLGNVEPGHCGLTRLKGAFNVSCCQLRQERVRSQVGPDGLLNAGHVLHHGNCLRA